MGNERINAMKESIISYFNEMHNRCLEYNNSYQSNPNLVFPYNQAQLSAYQDWINTTANQSNYFECDDLPWIDEIPIYAKTLIDAGVTEFAVTDRSSSLMSCLHSFANNGYNRISLCTVKRYEKRWQGTEVVSIQGVLLQLSD
ncbi:MAG: hypothetical protein Q4B26_18320 [Eubacteriales bacterium]|nr:hypothetical protein [Eubacteriales bacterium]